MAKRKGTNRKHAHLLQVRQELLRLQGFRCFYCAIKLDRYTVTYDHIELKCDGGTVTVDNGVASCRDCNWVRGDMPFDEFCEDMGIIMKRPRHKSDRFKMLCEMVD